MTRLKFFQDALGMNLDHIALEEGGQTRVAFMPIGGSEVELVEPQEAESGLAKFLAKRGEGIHHICFEVDDIDAALVRLKEHGAQLIDETPRVKRIRHKIRLYPSQERARRVDRALSKNLVL